MMVCVANPPLEPKKDDDPAKPNTMLIRWDSLITTYKCGLHIC